MPSGACLCVQQCLYCSTRRRLSLKVPVHVKKPLRVYVPMEESMNLVLTAEFVSCLPSKRSIIDAQVSLIECTISWFHFHNTQRQPHSQGNKEKTFQGARFLEEVELGNWKTTGA